MLLTAVPNTVVSTPATTSSTGLPFSINSDAERAQLYRPLMFMLVGVLLAAI